MDVGFVNEFHGMFRWVLSEVALQTKRPNRFARLGLDVVPWDSGWNDADGTPLLYALDGELNPAFRLREKGVILAHANVVTGVELGAALTYDDIARNNSLAAIHLDAQALRFRVAAVSSGAATFFVCHDCPP
jgi:hypothetical protein